MSSILSFGVWQLLLLVAAIVVAWFWLIPYVIPWILQTFGGRQGVLWGCRIRVFLGKYTNDNGISIASIDPIAFCFGQRNLAQHLRPAITANLNKEQFEGMRRYLDILGDSQKQSLSKGALLFFFGLTFVESYAMALAMGRLITAEGSVTYEVYMALAISSVVAFVFTWLMHLGGISLFRWQFLQEQKSAFRASLLEGRPPFYSDGIVYSSACFNKSDEAKPSWKKKINRLAFSDCSGKTFFLAVVIVVVVCAGLTVVRFTSFANAASVSSAQSGSVSGVGGDDPFKSFKDEGTESAKNPFLDPREDKTKNPTVGKTDDSGPGALEWVNAASGFAVLAVIFLMTQFVGLMASYRNALAGDGSDEAIGETLAQAQWESYCNQKKYQLIECDNILTSWHLKAENLIVSGGGAPSIAMRDFYPELKE